MNDIYDQHQEVKLTFSGRQRNPTQPTKYNKVHIFLRDKHNGGLSTRRKHIIFMLWFFQFDTRKKQAWLTASALMRDLFT